MAAHEIITWNVLHRIHAVNWQEAPVATFPDEAVRIARITDCVARWLAAGARAVCLQEVSGDQLASLRARLGTTIGVFSHLSPRLPRLRSPAPSAPPLTDVTEHLVTVVNGSLAHVIAAQAFANDPGKGYLAVALDAELLLINTHVTFGEPRIPQLREIAALARRAKQTAVIVGDFNAPADAVRAGLSEPLCIAELTGQRPTRIPTPDHPGRTIDHVVVLNGGELASATVLDGEGVSDHNPVSARVSAAAYGSS